MSQSKLKTQIIITTTAIIIIIKDKYETCLAKLKELGRPGCAQFCVYCFSPFKSYFLYFNVIYTFLKWLKYFLWVNLHSAWVALKFAFKNALYLYLYILLHSKMVKTYYLNIFYVLNNFAHYDLSSLMHPSLTGLNPCPAITQEKCTLSWIETWNSPIFYLEKGSIILRRVMGCFKSK